MTRALDWAPRFDERSKSYRILKAVPLRAPRSYTWRCLPTLDQGEEGACVGFGWAHELVARPQEIQGVSEAYARKIYRRAQDVDEWEGSDYDGTSVLAGAKTIKELGFIESYHWAFSFPEVQTALSWAGPVVLGCNWYEGMDEPNRKGVIEPTGEIMGGHCVLINGISIKDTMVRIHNSWGSSWGKNGEAFLSFRSLRKLLSEDAEACLPIGRKKLP